VSNPPYEASTPEQGTPLDRQNSLDSVTLSDSLRKIRADAGHAEELYFDRKSGVLFVRYPGDKIEDGDDVVPATRMAREGFFA
jgi:hypothetical protein